MFIIMSPMFIVSICGGVLEPFLSVKALTWNLLYSMAVV